MIEVLKLALIILAFFLSLGSTFFLINFLISLEIVGVDLHKKGRPKRPKMGGLGIAFAFTIVISIMYFIENSFIILVLLLAFLIEAAIGFMDDLWEFNPWQKVILTSFGAIPLLFLINLNPIAIILLFVVVMIASNWTNMLAGFNGLEAGLGVIILFFLAINTTHQDTKLLLLIYAVVLFAFLLLNKYPAKIFPGDVGTLPIGTILIGATLAGAPFYKLLILLVPHFVDSFLKFSSFGIMSSSMTRPTEIHNGYLTVSKNDKTNYLSLSRAILSIKPLREWELVLIIWTIEIILGVMTLLI